MSTIGRLAPSPTGGLHLGHARTFLVAWLSARSRSGRVVLRIEDLDASRVRAEARAGIVADLRWLGLDWDEGPDVGGPHVPYVQSERTTKYSTALARLRGSERIYPCTCTRSDVWRAASAPHAGEEEGPSYPGTCSGRRAADAEHLGAGPYSWRFRVPAGPVAWLDRCRGEERRDPGHSGGDFSVARVAAGTITFAYQLAVVCDDAAMGVTEVIRGDDLVPSTPRQILLYRALGWSEPTFGHLPLVLGPDGRRLAKRDASVKLATLRAAGADPRQLVGLLAHSLRLTDRPEPSTPADWLASFDLGLVPREPWVMPADLGP